MFLSVNMRSANIYRKVGAEANVLGADSHQLIGLLYEAVLKSLHEARAAFERADVAARTQAISRAMRLIDEGLIASLDMSRGGQVASSLRSVYDYSLNKLVDANLRANPALVDEVISVLKPVIDAWSEIRPQVIQGGLTMQGVRN
jgi:flagellar secretion chaperone FliS